jgi:hypothetical protein
MPEEFEGFLYKEGRAFMGSRELTDRLGEGRVSIGQVVRVYGGKKGAGLGDRVLVVGCNGIYDSRTKNAVNPKRALSVKKAKYGWVFDGPDLSLLPRSEIVYCMR